MKIHAVLGALAVLLMSACQSSNVMAKREVVRRPLLVQPADASQSPLYVWHGGGSSGGPLQVTIDLSQQKAFVFKNRQPLGWSYVATGRSGYRTPTGTFAISEKKAVKRSNKYGSVLDASGRVVNSNATAGVSPIPPGGRFVGAPMPYWMRLTNYGVGMHAGPIPSPGSPASHGCIRLPRDVAQKIFAEAGQGTRVTIVP